MLSELVPDGATADQILKGPEGDLLRRLMEKTLAEVMEGEVAAQIGAALHERAEGRVAHRNGYRERDFEPRVGSLSLAIPKLRQKELLAELPRAAKARREGSRRRDAGGHPARHVDPQGRRPDSGAGRSRTTTSRVSCMCTEFDEEVLAFRTRTLEEEVPYLWLDALYEKACEGGRVHSIAVAVATDVTV